MAKALTLIMLIFVSMAGWMYGADTGSIGGITNMRDFQSRYADKYDAATDTYSYTSARQGLITGIISSGSFFGALFSSPLADKVGKRISIIVWAVVYLIGIIVQVTTGPSWVQLMVAKIWTGISLGGLSVVAPGYQSEVAPASLRGAIVTTYQLFITLGIFVASCINMGTHNAHKSAQWRIPIGINLLWGIIMIFGILYLPESPRYLISIGKDDEALRIMSRNNDLPVEDELIQAEYHIIRSDCEAELAGGPAKWSEIFGADIRYRTFLGLAIMSLQPLTGANYYFLYGTQVFKGTGIDSPYLAALILDAVNFVCTIPAPWVLEYLGRRWPLIIGGVWQACCFFIYASVGDRALYRKDGSSNHRAGAVMIVFSCIYIVAYAQTWAPAAYVIVGESYPVRFRSKCSAFATSGLWVWCFCVNFFTPFISNAINFKYGYVFGGTNILAAIVVFFCTRNGWSYFGGDQYTVYLRSQTLDAPYKAY
ncbi:hexose transporter Ght5 [Schizosaccharomyces japonicus yFS275]|uniref:Hexose transporter Ght5 n=1 Tax=Schizosaccharomyces japonicus (strain yFS275 / FY16936) TaxID=402676 RepID=B6K2Y3_SCHJY|nr:hexose transporter Ght5 [Schizosaccharomyces japonicus yFS275]EEB07840.2 hexose transporter Ght5 [Schizosaccharomyces japonicus yFS275]